MTEADAELWANWSREAGILTGLWLQAAGYPQPDEEQLERIRDVVTDGVASTIRGMHEEGLGLPSDETCGLMLAALVKYAVASVLGPPPAVVLN